jgi:hypothetical protein
MYLISPDAADLENGLQAWQWIGLEDKAPVAVTAFADVFFAAISGVWFLETLEGTLTRICGSREELAAILQSDEGKNHYLAAGLVQRAAREGMSLEAGECYTFRVAPVEGGELSFENIEKRSVAEALSASGRVHARMRNLPDAAEQEEAP